MTVRSIPVRRASAAAGASPQTPVPSTDAVLLLTPPVRDGRIRHRDGRIRLAFDDGRLRDGRIRDGRIRLAFDDGRIRDGRLRLASDDGRLRDGRIRRVLAALDGRLRPAPTS